MRRLAPVAVAVLAAVLFAASAASAPRPAEVRVAFVRDGRIVLVARPLPPRVAPAAHALRQLLRGPTPVERAQGLRTAIAHDAVLRSLRLTDEAYVASFSARLLAPGTPQTAVTRFAQIAATVRPFHAAGLLAVAVNGRLVDTLSLTPAPPTWRPRGAPGSIRPGVYPYSLRGLQLRLASIGYLDRADVNGELDYTTSQALLAFQGWQGLDRTSTIDDRLQVELARASRPRPGSRAGPGRRIEIHRERGVLLMIENDEVVRAVHTSTGAYGRTPAGEFSVYRKEQMSWSNLFHVWMPYAAYFRGGIATHEYPDVPSYPASHGCVRLPAREAVRVWNFVSLGTPVRVF